MTVKDVWREYRHGSRESQHPIWLLEHNLGASWRSSSQQRKLFSRRNDIYREVHRMVDYRLWKRLSAGEVMKEELDSNSDTRLTTEDEAVEWLQAWALNTYTLHSIGRQIHDYRCTGSTSGQELPPFTPPRNSPVTSILPPGPWYT